MSNQTTNAPTFMLPKREALDSLFHSLAGFRQRQDLSPRERRLINEALMAAAQIRKG